MSECCTPISTAASTAASKMKEREVQSWAGPIEFFHQNGVHLPSAHVSLAKACRKTTLNFQGMGKYNSQVPRRRGDQYLGTVVIPATLELRSNPDLLRLLEVQLRLWRGEEKQNNGNSPTLDLNWDLYFSVTLITIPVISYNFCQELCQDPWVITASQSAPGKTLSNFSG